MTEAADQVGAGEQGDRHDGEPPRRRAGRRADRRPLPGGTWVVRKQGSRENGGDAVPMLVELSKVMTTSSGTLPHSLEADTALAPRPAVRPDRMKRVHGDCGRGRPSGPTEDEKVFPEGTPNRDADHQTRSPNSPIMVPDADFHWLWMTIAAELPHLDPRREASMDGGVIGV